MPSSAPTNQPPENQPPLPGSERPRPETHQLVGPANPAEVIGITVIVRSRPGSPPLPDLEHWQNTPPGRRRFLTPAEYARTYGASRADLNAVSAFAAGHGLTVVESHPGRRTVTLQGTVQQLNEAFGITLNQYEAPRPPEVSHTSEGARSQAQSPGRYRYHGYDGAVHLPAQLANVVQSVVGLDDRSLGSAGGSSGDPPNSKQLSVPTVAGLYNFPNTGANDQTIGVIAPSDPPGMNRRLSGYLTNDILNLYFPNLSDSNYRTKPTLNDIGLTVGTNPYSNFTSAVAAGSNFALEVTQDISTSATVAQGANINVYFTELSEQGLVVCFNRILLPESEKQPTVVTCSFNFFGSDGSIGSASTPGSAAAVMSAQFQQLAAVGINVFIISQDKGSDDGVTDGKTHVNYPGSDPWVTCVGGTVIGNLQTGPPVTFDEWVWSNVGSTSAVGGFAGASGGGASATFPVPSYQSAAGITQITDSQGNTSSNRFIPDIAGMVAYGGSSSSSASDWFYFNGNKTNFVGTSCATPLFAGLVAVLRSALGQAIGFLNPTLYQLGNSVCNDITHGNNDPSDGSNAPYYSAGTGWDACTGWGSVDGTKLLNALAGLMFAPAYYFQLEKTTFGLDEVKANAAASGDSTYTTAISLVIEGFTPDAVMAANLHLTVTTPAPGVTVTVGALSPELPNETSTPQRIFFQCTLVFAHSALAAVPSGIFPSPNSAPIEVPLTASSVVIGTFSRFALTELTLVPGADPAFANFNAQGTNVFYLSEDLRVFTVTPGVNGSPFAGVSWPGHDFTNFDTASAFQYLQKVLNTLNTNSGFNSGGADPFASLPDQSNALTGDSSVTPFSVNPANPLGTPFANYNVAIARVRLTGAPSASTTKNVRVFFRLFLTSTSDTDYLPTFSYPSNPDAAGFPGSPSLGVGDPPVTIPFFATGNYENVDGGVNQDYPATGTSPNSFPIQIPTSGTAWAYYGCYLNLYQTANTLTVNGSSKPVQAYLPGTHNCLVAQIAFDDAPIPSGVTVGPQNSDKLAQRNLQITLSDNPGPAATHRIPQTFDLRPSSFVASIEPGNLQTYPDELMIDWGDIPAGSLAQIFWPQVAAAEILALAHQLYSTHQLSSVDPHTIGCVVPRGRTFVPIPAGNNENFAGLFTVDLPTGIVRGQVFTLTVHRLSTQSADLLQAPQIEDQTIVTHATARGKGNRSWRTTVGSFAVRIPVTVAERMLPLEENALAILRWRLQQFTQANRWYPVLQRYIDYIGGRVAGLGGDPVNIPPSPTGYHPLPKKQGKTHEWTGKIEGLKYDRFGDFCGFCLRTESGEEREFHSRESEIERLVAFAWRDRVVLTVVTTGHHSTTPASIVLRRIPPRPPLWD